MGAHPTIAPTDPDPALAEAERRIASLEKERDRCKESWQEAWVALRMIRDAMEELGPVGVLPSDEAADMLYGPTFIGGAEALITGLQKMHDRAVAAEAELERLKASDPKPAVDRTDVRRTGGGRVPA